GSGAEDRRAPRAARASGRGRTPSATASATRASRSAADGLELAAVALELVALVRHHRRRAGDLLPQARALGLDVAVRLDPLRLDNRGEDPSRVALERGRNA